MSRFRIGDIRPAQFMYTYGIGSIIDLPALSVIVLGLDFWDLRPDRIENLNEPRLLAAVQHFEWDVQRLIALPRQPDGFNPADPFAGGAPTGLPVQVFPRWLVCSQCGLLAPIDSGLFDFKKNFHQLEKNRFVHRGCEKGREPQANPVRFLAACENGHLDDFPWVNFVHDGTPCSAPSLRYYEHGLSGEARGIVVSCTNCSAKQNMSSAFRRENRDNLPLCRGHHPHLPPDGEESCELHIRPIVLGASNSWFPVVQNVISVPMAGPALEQLIDQHWDALIDVQNAAVLPYLRSQGRLSNDLAAFPDSEIMQAIEAKRQTAAGERSQGEPADLKGPEWDVFIGRTTAAVAHPDFQLNPVPVPDRLQPYLSRLVLVERLREVSALIGFTRIDSFGEFIDPDLEMEIPRVPLYRHRGQFMPAAEVRGEGIFLALSEEYLHQWERSSAVREREEVLFASHRSWRQSHFVENPDENFPGIRYLLLHSLSHALMRQLSLECGYPASSIRERIYASTEESAEPMAGILLYTAAPDSDGTLGGLVEMGKPENFEHILQRMLEDQSFCANDPSCAENEPDQTGITIHGAACHACQFSPETSCERGNKYLDRSLLTATIEHDNLAFFRGLYG